MTTTILLCYHCSLVRQCAVASFTDYNSSTSTLPIAKHIRGSVSSIAPPLYLGLVGISRFHCSCSELDMHTQVPITGGTRAVSQSHNQVEPNGWIPETLASLVLSYKDYVATNSDMAIRTSSAVCYLSLPSHDIFLTVSHSLVALHHFAELDASNAMKF